MKVAFLLPKDLLSGGIFVALEHASRLSKHGIDPIIIFKEPTPEGVHRATEEFQLRVISWEEALNQEFDLVIASWWETAIDMYRLRSDRYAHFVQSDERKFYHPDHLDPTIISLLYSEKVALITEARWIKDLFKNEFDRDAALAPNGVSPTAFFPDTPLEPSSSKLRVLIEGSAEVPYKRTKFAFEVLNQLQGIEVWYACSDGDVDPTWRVDKLFNKVSRTEMRRIYSSCDVLLKLSTVEGFFCPPLEMMACGGTVVVSNVTGFDEFVVHEKNGLVVDIDDKAAAVAALKRLQDDRELLARLKSEALLTAKRMGWDDSSAVFAQFIKDIPKDGLSIKRKTLPLQVLYGVSRIQDVATKGEFKTLMVDVDRQMRELAGYMRSQVERLESVIQAQSSTHSETRISNLENAFDELRQSLLGRINDLEKKTDGSEKRSIFSLVSGKKKS